MMNLWQWLGLEKASRSESSSAIAPGRMRVSRSPRSIPREPGVYRHVNKRTGSVLYIGQTCNLARRQREHAAAGRLNFTTHEIWYGVARKGANVNDRCTTEKRQIKKWQPSRNKSSGGNGRREGPQ